MPLSKCNQCAAIAVSFVKKITSYPQNILEKFEMRVISIDKNPYNKTVVEEPLGIARRKEGWKEKRRRKRIFVTYVVAKGMKKRRKVVDCTFTLHLR